MRNLLCGLVAAFALSAAPVFGAGDISTDQSFASGAHQIFKNGAFLNFVTGARWQIDGTNVGANQLVYSNGSQNIAKVPITSYGLSLLNAGDAGVLRGLISADALGAAAAAQSAAVSAAATDATSKANAAQAAAISTAAGDATTKANAAQAAAISTAAGDATTKANAAQAAAISTAAGDATTKSDAAQAAAISTAATDATTKANAAQSGRALVSASLSQFAGGSYAYRDIYQIASDEVDKRIQGVTAGNTAQKIYSSQDDSGAGAYVRSTTLFARDVDLTCVSVYNDGGDARQTATLISPRHVLLANHYFPASGTHFRFVATDGTVVTRTLNSSTQGSMTSTDIRIGLLDSDAPDTITPAKVLNATQEAGLVGAALIFVDQAEKIFVGDMTAVANSVVTDAQSVDATRATYWKDVITGDSSHPVFAILDGRAVLLGVFASVGTSPSVAQNATAINAAMATLGTSYRLTQFPLSRRVEAADLHGIVPLGNLPVVAGAGTGHAAGLVPDPGGTPDNSQFLRKDGTFATPTTVTQSDIILTQTVSSSTGTVQINDGVNVVILALSTSPSGLTLQLPSPINFPATKQITILDPRGFATVTTPVTVTKSTGVTVSLMTTPSSAVTFSSDGISAVTWDNVSRLAGFTSTRNNAFNNFKFVGPSGSALIEGNAAVGSPPTFSMFGVPAVGRQTGDIATALINYGWLNAASVVPTLGDANLATAVKPSVAVVADSNVTLSGEQTIDSQLTSSSLVLCVAQTDATQNGPWTSGSGAWTRPTWYPTGSTAHAPRFLTTDVRLGTTYGGSKWRMTTAAVTIGTTATTWTIIPLNVNNVTGTLSGANVSGVGHRVTVPTTSTDACSVGDWSANASYHFDCINTNTWVRSAASTF